MADTETLVAYPTAFDSQYSYASVNSSYPTSNPIGKSSSNTTFTQINLKTGSSAETYFYYDFDLSAIPEKADIVSVACKYKAYISTTSTSYVSSRSCQLYSGSTAKGSAGTFSTSASVTALTTGTWTRDELQSARIRFYAKRGSSRTTSTYYIRFYGADLTVTYEDNSTIYTVTVQSADITTDKTGANEVKENKSFTVNISELPNAITDNGNNVLSALVEKHDTTALTKYPESYTTSGTIQGTYYQNAIGESSSNTASGNDYASSSGSNATIYYSFDFSDIPENATIESVEVIVGGHCESTTQSSEVANLQLYSGSTAKGSQSSFTTTSKQLVTMSVGEWTRVELQDAKLAFTIGYYGGQVNGVDFIVYYSLPTSATYYQYTISSVNADHTIIITKGDIVEDVIPLFVKHNGAFKRVTKIYKKIDGTWTEIEVSDIDTTKKFTRIIIV